MPLRRLLPLLSCPLCAVDGGGPPRPLLRHPFTLHCGHTVCSSHLETLDPSQRCPLPICSATPNSNIPHPNIPSSSRVIYLPPVPTPGSARPSTSVSADQHEQRTDITISKLIEVVSRYSRPSPSPSNRGDSDLSDGDDHQLHPLGHSPPTTALPSSDEETEFRVTRDLGRSSGYRRRRRPDPERAPQPTIPNHSESTSTNSTTVASADSIESGLPPSSGHAGRSCFPPPTTAGGNSDGSDSTIQPPKKRPRHDTRPSVTDQKTQSHAIEPGAETGNSENIYPPGANGLHSSRLGAEPRGNPEDGDENPQTRIEKELLTELTCEICLAIYFQPVTALCQHVSCLPFFFRNLLVFCHLPFHPLSTRILFGAFYTMAPTPPRSLRPQADVRPASFHFILTDALLSRGFVYLIILFGRRSAGDAYKGPWTTGVTALSAGRICLTMHTCMRTLKTKSSCR